MLALRSASMQYFSGRPVALQGRHRVGVGVGVGMRMVTRGPVPPTLVPQSTPKHIPLNAPAKEVPESQEDLLDAPSETAHVSPESGEGCASVTIPSSPESHTCPAT